MLRPRRAALTRRAGGGVSVDARGRGGRGRVATPRGHAATAPPPRPLPRARSGGRPLTVPSCGRRRHCRGRRRREGGLEPRRGGAGGTAPLPQRRPAAAETRASSGSLELAPRAASTRVERAVNTKSRRQAGTSSCASFPPRAVVHAAPGDAPTGVPLRARRSSPRTKRPTGCSKQGRKIPNRCGRRRRGRRRVVAKQRRVPPDGGC